MAVPCPWRFGERGGGVAVAWLCSSGRFGMGGYSADCELSSAWLLAGVLKAPLLGETGDTVSARPGTLATLRVLGDGLGGGGGAATESLASSCLPPYATRGTGGPPPGALSASRKESARPFLTDFMTKKMMTPITASPPMTPTTAPTMTPVPGPLEFSVLPPWFEPFDPSLLEPPVPLPFPFPFPLPPVSCGPPPARLGGEDCSTEFTTPVGITDPAAALQ